MKTKFENEVLGLIFMYVLMSVVAQKNESVIIGFQIDGTATSESFLKYKREFPTLSQFSVCFRLHIIQYRPLIPVISYATDSFDNEIVIAYVTLKKVFMISCSNPPISFRVSFELILDSRDSFCFAIDLQKKIFEGTINEMIFNGADANLKSNKSFIMGKGYFYIGQEQDDADGGFQKHNSLTGYISDFYFYERLLTEQEMLGFTSCFRNETLSSERLLFDFSNIEKDFNHSRILISYQKPNFYRCGSTRDLYILFPGERTFNEGMRFCNSMGGELVVPKNAEENSKFFEFTNKNGKKCPRSETDISWLGVVANETGKFYQNYKTEERLQYENRRKDFALDWSLEQCTTFYGIESGMSKWRSKWNPVACSYTTCVACHFPHLTPLNLRGLCSKSVFDREYFIVTKNITDYFKGTFYSFMEYVSPLKKNSNDRGAWIMYRRDMPEVKAVLKVGTDNQYPIGKNSWNITGDVCGVSKVDLMLTVCSKGHFTCDDGSCVESSKRCNLEVDCLDASDELDCLPLVLPKQYSRLISPPRPSKNLPLDITMFMNIHSIQSFDLSGFKFSAEMTLTLSWRDSRVKFKNLKFSEKLNIIDRKAENEPWTPSYQFLGDQDSTSKVEDLSLSINIRRNSNPMPDSDENVSPDKLFLGNENDLVLTHKFLLTTSCQFDLSHFPFDSQICSVFILLEHGDEDYLRFIPVGEGVIFSGKRRLLQYLVKELGNYRDNCGEKKCDTIKIQFDSLSSFYIVNTYIPTLIMLVIGYLPFYFILDDFNDRITVTVTSLLVEATFLSQLTSTAPKTAYMKMIDIWCLFCIIVLFSIAIFQTCIHYLFRKARNAITKVRPIKVTPMKKKDFTIEKMKGKSPPEFLNMVGIIIYPVIVFVFVVIYVVTAINQIGPEDERVCSKRVVNRF